MTAISRTLTGITTSGTPHLGNYVGAIRPAIAASRQSDAPSFYFLADYHALIKTTEPARVHQSTLEIAASWLAAGLDPNKVVFYRQSDIPEITELCWLLTCVAGKGLLNRAHAYKAAVDKNQAAGVDADDGVTAGLFMYPVLMAADILLFGANRVPVGRDQIQHIEMARDLANRFNHLYGTDLTEPQAMIEDHVATLPGLDGRKMSKSYDNTIALFAAPAQLRKQIMGLITDSRLPGEPKDTEGSALFQLYQAFATPEQTQAMRQAFVQGIAWADAKGQLFDCIDQSIAPMRSAYEQYMANPAQIEAILQAGAQKARAVATPTMQRLRHAVGLRTLSSSVNANAAPMPQTKLALPSFKQYREADGQFYFKLHSGQGVLMIQSPAYAQPKDCGQAIAQLQQHGSGVLAHLGLVLAPAMQADVLDAELAAWRSAKAKP